MGKILDGFDPKSRDNLIKQVKASKVLLSLPDRIRQAIVEEVNSDYPDDKPAATEKASKDQIDAIMKDIM